MLLDDGTVYQSCIIYGAGEQPVSEYVSTIYYHSNTPNWNETIKLDIPIELFERAHVRFQFKHCSSGEAKDKNQVFCFAYLPLKTSEETTVAVSACLCEGKGKKKEREKERERERERERES